MCSRHDKQFNAPMLGATQRRSLDMMNGDELSIVNWSVDGHR